MDTSNLMGNVRSSDKPFHHKLYWYCKQHCNVYHTIVLIPLRDKYINRPDRLRQASCNFFLDGYDCEHFYIGHRSFSSKGKMIDDTTYLFNFTNYYGCVREYLDVCELIGENPLIKKKKAKFLN